MYVCVGGVYNYITRIGSKAISLILSGTSLTYIHKHTPTEKKLPLGSKCSRMTSSPSKLATKQPPVKKNHSYLRNDHLQERLFPSILNHLYFQTDLSEH